MNIRVCVTNKFIVDGREYGSLEEMPVEIREAYEKAVTGSCGQKHDGMHEKGRGTLLFNGKEYAGVDAMPNEVRELYEAVMKAIGKEGVSVSGSMDKDPGYPLASGQIPTVDRKPIAPLSSLTPQTLIYITALLGSLLGAVYLLLVSGW